jgi:hypothetical protein
VYRPTLYDDAKILLQSRMPRHKLRAPRRLAWSRSTGFLLTLLTAASLTSASCVSTRPCRTGTLLVSVTLDAAAAMADKLAIAVVVAGGSPTTTLLDHTAGQTTGTVEIDFPGGYPSGQLVHVALIATRAGAPVGLGVADRMLSDGCESIAVSVIGGTGGDAGSSGGSSGTGGHAAGGQSGGDDGGGLDAPGSGGSIDGGGGTNGAGGRDGGATTDGGGLGGTGAGGSGTGGRGTGGSITGMGGSGAGGSGAGGASGCPVGQTSICGGICYATTTDRAHCGTTCAVCAATEVCANACTTAIAPLFMKVPPDPAGWLDPNGIPLSLTVRSAGYANAIYECRTGPDLSFTPTVPAWAPCDGATGVGLTHTPAPTTAAPEGNYRTEHRYRADTYVSPVIAARYYVHHALDKVANCPRPGNTTDGPHFTDTDYFTAAQVYANANPALFPVATAFPASSAIPVRTDTIYLRNPFIKIPFTAVSETTGMYASIPAGTLAAWPAKGDNYVFNERSLRHAWSINTTRTMVLMKRRYVSPAPVSNCAQQFREGHNFVGGEYAYHLLSCEALVLNTHGNGLCFSTSGNVMVPVPVETSANGTGTVNATFNSATVVGVGTNFLGSAGRFIQIPSVTGRWYKILTAPTTTTISISPAFVNATAGGLTYRLASANTYVIPAAFAKMHFYDAHNFATGATKPYIPSPHTKCETVGCNAGKPWLTYLPP